MNFGEKIRYLREEAGLSQTQLGEKISMTQRRVSYIENGKYEPCLEDIRRICLFFGVSADYMLAIPKGLEYPER